MNVSLELGDGDGDAELLTVAALGVLVVDRVPLVGVNEINFCTASNAGLRSGVLVSLLSGSLQSPGPPFSEADSSFL